MSRVAVVSDIHGNLQALQAVLADVDGQGVDATVCLGDVVGYGADPEACVTLVRSRAIPCIVGNHELALSDPRGLEWFNPQARVALRRTRVLLSPRSLAYLSALPRSLVQFGARFVHGVPPEDPYTYVFELSEANLARMFETLAEPLCFVGHTHEPLLATWAPGSPARLDPLPQGATPLEPGRKHLVNPGSVGQPRDGDPRAAYAIWDTQAGTVELRRIPYDVKTAASRILGRGLGKRYAERLYG